jgi:predicted transposase YdaD
VRFDEALKQLLQFAHSRLVESLAGAPVRKWLNVELSATQMRRVDLLAELENGQLFHLELQSRNDSRIGKRLLEYRLLIEQMHQRPPVQMVLYVGSEPLAMAGVLDEAGLRFVFGVMDIRDFDPHPLLVSPAIEDRILSILCGVENPRESALRVLREIGELPQPERGDALAKLLVISGLRRLHGEIRQEVRHMPLFEHPLENPFLLDLFLEGKEEGKAEGKAEGIAMGREQARAAEAARFITQILQHRFGPLPEWAQTKIKAESVERLENLVDQVLDAPNLEQALKGD